MHTCLGPCLSWPGCVYKQFRIICYQLCTYIAHCSNSPEAIRGRIFMRTETFLRLVTASQASLVNAYNEVCIVHSTYICTYVQTCVHCQHLKCIAVLSLQKCMTMLHIMIQSMQSIIFILPMHAELIFSYCY